LVTVAAILAAMTLVVMTTKRHFQTVERLPITEEKDCSPKTGISGLDQFT
jgi:hypothetical protein